MRLTHAESEQSIEVDPSRLPLYASQGWREASTDAPAGNASKDEWLTYAAAQGLDATEAEAMTRDELRAALS